MTTNATRMVFGKKAHKERKPEKQSLKSFFVLLLHVKHGGRGIDHLLCENVFTTWMSTTVDEAHATARSGMMKILMIGDESAIRIPFRQLNTNRSKKRHHVYTRNLC